MKMLILALVSFLLTSPAQAQTLKWTHTLAGPSFPFVYSYLQHLRADPTANVAVIVGYEGQNGGGSGTIGYRLVWLSAAGKTLHSLEYEANEKFPTVLQVSATQLVVSLRVNDLPVVRRYTRSGAKIKVSEVALGQNETPVGADEGAGGVNQTRDATGFFVTGTNQTGEILHTVKRYTVR